MGKPKRILKPEKYPLLSTKTNQFIDKIIRVSKPKFPETFTINDGYMSGIKRTQFAYPHTDYIEMHLVIKPYFGWASISVMMTAGEFYQIAKKSYDKRFLKLFQRLIERGNVPFRDFFDSYVHFRGAELTVFQVVDDEIKSEYYTNGIIKLRPKKSLTL